MVDYKIVKYGMSQVYHGRKYINNGKFKVLENLIRCRIRNHFNETVDDETIRNIFESAAESLKHSWFFYKHILIAEKLYTYLGVEEKAEESRGFYNNFENRIKFGNHFGEWIKKKKE